MASAADYVKLLDEPKPFDAAGMITTAGKGIGLAQGITDRNTLYDVGAKAAAGDMAGAQQAAYAGGNPDLAMKMDTHQREQGVQALRTLDEFAKTAQSQDDAQWHQSVQMWRSQGLNVPAQYEGPQGRQLAVAHSMDTMERLKAELTRAQTNQANAGAATQQAHAGLFKLQTETAQRELDNPAAKLTIVPEGATVIASDPRTRQSQVLHTGPRKIDGTEKKEIQEADDMLAQTKTALQSIDRAMELNSQAYAGTTAGWRAGAVNNTIGAVRPVQSGIATAEMENVVTTQALNSLRATFGGNPTDGERKILLEVAGSVNQPRSVRQQILERAKQMAQQRLELNQQKADALRGGTYYQPGGQPPATRTNTGALQEARGAIARGAPRDKVIERLRANGIDPTGL